ncbi:MULTISPECIES: penicillin-binding protein activator [unclassified Sphingomonas]|uniref:penicillin-binding protein activator n=1 Tax=unclassified Sphingomonas TaxID=196159 RepID=UPI00161875B2|nr:MULTISPECIES: penicillin-binding protein activator [unclassified Sphingomonas]MBB3345612.1 ABC-type branched-subunit amino acid transport system substrate-binding protein [Sphingomonas sp. BK069]MBB3474763.1 ABC-type branched-subunit amino acid transport system substrate-binding protein [Sphingomonas sp. BK345]
MAEAIGRPQWSNAWGRLVAVTGALLLAACSTVVPRAPVEAPRAQTQAPPPRDTAPEVVSGLPRDTERHRVALLVPLSGSNAGVGRSLANATQLALLDTRNAQVRITSYDTATGAAQAASRAIADGAQLILGPLLAEDVRAVAPIAHAAQVPVLSFSNDTGVAGNGTYVLGYAPAQSIERVVGFARARGMNNFGGLVPNALYGSRASTAFLRAVEQAGGRVVSLQTYDRGPGALSAAVQRMVKDAPFDAILIADSAGSATAAVPLLRRNSPSAQILGTELWNADKGASAPALSGSWFASVPDDLYRQYARNYRTRFNAAPYRLSSLGYDSVLLVVRIARDWKPGTAFPEPRLRDADGFAGIDGAFRFGRDGVAERALEVKELRAGGAVAVSPAPTGFAGK